MAENHHPVKPPLLVAIGNSKRGRTLVIGLSLRDLADALMGETVLQAEADVTGTSFLTERVLVTAGRDASAIEKTMNRLGVRLSNAPVGPVPPPVDKP